MSFVAGLGREIPLHLSAYFPCYKMTIEPTPLSTLLRAREIAEKELHYVYLGNVQGGGRRQHPLPQLPQPAGEAGRLLHRGDGDQRRELRQLRPPGRLRLLTKQEGYR